MLPCGARLAGLGFALTQGFPLMLSNRRGIQGPGALGRRALGRRAFVAGAIAVVASALPAAAQSEGADELLSAIVQIKTYINPDGRTSKVSASSAPVPALSSTTKD